jgi:hypothetical protein
MEFANRKFRNNRTGEIVKVIDTFENIAILENKQKVDVRQLSDPLQYTEEIDPSAFFNTQGAYNFLAEKIKNIPTHMIQDGPEEIVTKFGGDMPQVTNESAIIMTTEEDEMVELARKYGVEMDNTSQIVNQQSAFAKILGEDTEDMPVVKPFKQEEPITRVEVERESPVQVQQPTNKVVSQVTNQFEDPIITMFRKTKRNVELNFNINISERIPRLDFIEMMEDSYEISMIDFLADEFTNKILEDPSSIRESIKLKIKNLVYGAGIKDSANSQITDSVTEKHEPLSIEKEPVLTKDLPKKTTTRKPRAKKESTKND